MSCLSSEQDISQHVAFKSVSESYFAMLSPDVLFMSCSNIFIFPSAINTPCPVYVLFITKNIVSISTGGAYRFD